MKSGDHGRRTADEVRFDEALGAAIRRQRQTKGMSQSEVGNAIDQSFQQIQKYEQGTNSVKVCRLMRLAEVLDTTPAALVAAASGDFGDVMDDDRSVIQIMRNYLAAAPEIQKAVQAFLSGGMKATSQ